MSKRLDLVIACVEKIRADYPSIEWVTDEDDQLIVWDEDEYSDLK